MVFASNVFLFTFLPVTLIGYYLINPRFKNFILITASLTFYAWGEPVFVFAMIASILANYIFALNIDRFRGERQSKIWLITAIFMNIAFLGVFKYLNFITVNINRLFGPTVHETSIVLPIGISFFTFQAMSYVFDVYRNIGRVQRNPLNVMLYISLFPQLIAGPIVRFQTIESQINGRRETLDCFISGVERFIIGLSKKVLLANTFAIIADKAFNSYAADEISVSFAWLGALSYTLQIYFDFSAYSDMAIGLGLMFGFKFEENFNYPYISANVSEFWRRWHISLGTWFRDYVYFPMGGSRVEGKGRLIFNLFVVWLLTGAWHGASWHFIAWGLGYFILITLEKTVIHPDRFKGFHAFTYRLFTLLCVVLGWVVFRANGTLTAIQYMQSMFGLNGNALHDPKTMVYIREYFVYFTAGIVFSMPAMKWLQDKVESKRGFLILSVVTSVAYAVLLVFSISSLVQGNYNPFLYFNF